MKWRKTAQVAVGIPDRARFVSPPETSDPKIWQFTRHAHEAERAGKHYDLRLGDPKTGLTYNWAGKKWPEPGKGTYVVMQPTHDYDYLTFEGEIPSGYGKGWVEIDRKEPTEVVSSRPDRVEFNLYKGRTPEQYVLRQAEDTKWVLHNTTPTRQTNPWKNYVPDFRPKYREGNTERINFADGNEILQAKIDGAHAIYAIRKGKPMKAFSYRISKASPTGLIEHTYKIPGWDRNVAPAELDGTVLRGELYARDRKGKALKEKDIGAILNTSTLKSRQKQKQIGGLQTAAFDVVRYRGKDVTNLPYEKRLGMVKDVVSKVPGLHLPPMAETPREKQKLIQKIRAGKEKLTREGAVAWDLKKNKTTKLKFRPDYDVYVRGVVPSTHPGWAGAVEYSLTPKGPVVGTMGSGFTHAQRKAMLKNPKKYVGRVARVKAHEQFESGALRVPVFKGWHISKSEEKLYKEGAFKVLRRGPLFALVDARGRILGRHSSYENAKKQERAIHAARWTRARHFG
jgi:hypothetical protein